MTAPLLEISNLEAVYYTPSGPVKALRGVDLYVKRGESVGVAGESGCGKSTLALSVLDLFDRAEGAVSGGRISFSGMDLSGLDEKQMQGIRGKRISLIMQDPYGSFNPVIRIGRQMEEICRVHGMRADETSETCLRMLEEVNLDRGVREMFPHQLSGGMLQRASIAAALLNSPELLIADEPTSNLDVTIQKKIIDNLGVLRKKHSLSLVFITHNLNLLSSLADRIYILYAGQVLEYGPAEDIFSRPAHPYTKGLLGALPDIKTPGSRIRPIPGSVPSPADTTPGCVFFPRCSRGSERCGREKELIRVSEEHYSRCSG